MSSPDRQLSLSFDSPPVETRAYSHSALKTFETCPLQYRYKYVEGLRTGRETVEAFLGSRVHEALEWLYREVLLENAVSLEDFLEEFRRLWAERWHENVVLVRKNLPSRFYSNRGEECLKQYYERHRPFAHGSVIGLEMTLPITLEVGCDVPFTGVIDRLVEVSSGRFEIHDYKTAGRLPALREMSRDRQMGLYQIGVRQMFPDCGGVEVVWHYLVFDKQMRVPFSEADLEWVKWEALRIVKRIEGETRFPASPGPLCRWCEYVEICPEGGAQARAR
jgi:putative RecB family exonuclease